KPTAQGLVPRLLRPSRVRRRPGLWPRSASIFPKRPCSSDWRRTAQLAALDRKIAETSAQHRSYEVLEALYDTGPPPETYVHRRGDFESKGDAVQPAGLEVLSKPGERLDHPAGF